MDTYRAASFPSPVGLLTVLSDGGRIAGLWLEGQKHFGAEALKNAQYEEDDALREARTWLGRYFAGERPERTPPLAPAGSAFQRSVWALLRQIPYGGTTTYGALARTLEAQTGRGASARAVGGAVGHNPISLLIPCHRVLGAAGSLAGYAGGVAAERYLLTLEGALTPPPAFSPAP